MGARTSLLDSVWLQPLPAGRRRYKRVICVFETGRDERWSYEAGGQALERTPVRCGDAQSILRVESCR